MDDAETLRSIELRCGCERGDVGKECLGKPDEEILWVLLESRDGDDTTGCDKEGMLTDAGSPGDDGSMLRELESSFPACDLAGSALVWATTCRLNVRPNHLFAGSKVSRLP